MDQKEFEDLIKNWQKMIEGFYRMATRVDAISNAITKKMQQNTKEMERWLDPMRRTMAEYERSIKRTMDSVKSIGEAFARDMDKIGALPDAMTEDIRECALKLGRAMEPVLESLRELQERWREY